MAAETEIKSLQARIDYLEDNRRYIQNALETVLSLGGFQSAVSEGSNDIESLLEQASHKICGIVPFTACAFFLVDEESYLFDLAFCSESREKDYIEQEVEFMVD